MFKITLFIGTLAIILGSLYVIILVTAEFLNWISKFFKKRQAPILSTDTRAKAFLLVDDERNRQDAKWGEQNHHPLAWNSLIGEEKGEFEQAINQTYIGDPGEKGGYDNMMAELSQVAATAIAAMESLMRNRGKEE